jgi:hypothetical protein
MYLLITERGNVQSPNAEETVRRTNLVLLQDSRQIYAQPYPNAIVLETHTMENIMNHNGPVLMQGGISDFVDTCSKPDGNIGSRQHVDPPAQK